MKSVSDYRSEMLTILGDATGRRHSETVLDMGLKQALHTLRRFRPNKETVRIRISEVSGKEAIAAWDPDPDAEIITIRNAAGEWMNAADYRAGGKLYLHFYDYEKMPSAGDELFLEVAEDHRIRDLDGAVQTTVPDSLMLTVCTGAAGYAMEIRARSITEVFGKRPEDGQNLRTQSAALLDQYIADLSAESYREYLHSDPWKEGGFPI